MGAIDREDLRERGTDLRLFGQRVAELSEEVAHMAQAYRNLYERLRLAQKPSEVEARSRSSAARPHRALHAERPRADPPLDPRAELRAVQRALRGLLERQGDLGRKLQALARNPLLEAGGDDPRRIKTRLGELGQKCQNLQLSSDPLIHGTPRAVSGLLEDLCELNSGASEDLLRFGQGLRSRGEGLLAGRKEDRRYLHGATWRRLH